MDIVDAVAVVMTAAAMLVLAANIALAIYNIRMMRRYQLLCMVLMEIACRSFLSKHMPFWIAWPMFSGLRFRMEIEPIEEADTRQP